MKYSGVCIAVKDINLSRKFYEDVFGLKVFQDYGINISFGELSLQQEFDWLVDIPKENIVTRPNNMELYFEEDDFDDFVKTLEKRKDIEYLGNGVKEANWGQRSIRFYDPDGHIIEVGENIIMVIKRFSDIGMTLEQISKRMDVSMSDLEKLLQFENEE